MFGSCQAGCDPLRRSDQHGIEVMHVPARHRVAGSTTNTRPPTHRPDLQGGGNLRPGLIGYSLQWVVMQVRVDLRRACLSVTEHLADRE